MLSPEAPLEKLYEIAATKKLCYEYKNSAEGYAVVMGNPIYPSNTAGYYIAFPTGPDITIHETIVYQSPMFLMKYFAAVAAGEAGSFSLLLLDVAPYIESTKRNLLTQVTGLSWKKLLSLIEGDPINITLNKLRIERPHLPDSYYLLASKLTGSEFTN